MIETIEKVFPDQHQSVDRTQWDNIYVVGDVHGCVEEFEELIELIDLSSDELLVCVGDLIRKGPDSAGAVEIVERRDNVISVLGNGEFDYLNGDKTAPGLSEKHREMISGWPLIVTWSGNIVVHGGFDPDKPLEEHTADDIVNMRAPKKNNNYETPFWFDEFDREERVFFGHTATNKPIHQANAVALDTGCVYGGELTAFDTESNAFITVSSRKTYEPREDHKYADTTRENSAQ